MASAVYILDLKGKVLISRNYRGDIPATAVEKFMPLVLEAEEEQAPVPCFSDEGINYLYIRHNNLYLLAITRKNSNATSIMLFLHKLTEFITFYPPISIRFELAHSYIIHIPVPNAISYCCRVGLHRELEEESIRDNFVIIYELLDEMMDFGYPQTTETKILQEYITQDAHKLEIRPPPAVTNAVSWRSEGIKYRKNEVFLDVIESVNLLVNANGNVLLSEILGSVKMRCYLSGMPELRLGLNDKVMFEATGRAAPARGKAIEMEDVKFHQCVRLSRFENDRTISFIPPDGEFELMSYRLQTNVKPLIWVEAVVENYAGSRAEYMVKAKAQFKRRSAANNVEICIPVSDDADTPKFRSSIGSVTYAPEKSCLVWKIKQFQGGKEFLMRAHFGLPSVKGADELEKRPPMSVKFEIPYFTVSGIQVRYLKIVEKSGYQALPWVRLPNAHARKHQAEQAAANLKAKDYTKSGASKKPTGLNGTCDFGCTYRFHVCWYLICFDLTEYFNYVTSKPNNFLICGWVATAQWLRPQFLLVTRWRLSPCRTLPRASRAIAHRLCQKRFASTIWGFVIMMRWLTT
ncbi:Mu homology domain-containing protein [Endogone sp. FLAS-F59071]|nr:Mu homology domain-containing protein [Endogone sp. FLAS-F59071]|eukprot:RUS15512.1 Mu homology domain-containing protein [Endogone sp. FLAS-F59071]